MPVETTDFGTTPAGENVTLFTLSNATPLRARIMSRGATLIDFEAPDRDGTLGHVTLGYDSLEDYIRDCPYFGCIVGRFGNRICRGCFSLDGTDYTLATNDKTNHLHGGPGGFDKVLWQGTPGGTEADPAVTFTYRSVDGEEGYPGNLDVTVVYTLTAAGEMRIDYTATTDAPTIINLTQHSYWNLADGGASDVLGHELTLHAGRYLPVDETLIPTGERAPVAGGPMDFTSARAVGERIGDVPGGYDHCWIIDGQAGVLRPTARVVEPVSGRVMEVQTSEPGVQFYSGNFLDGSRVGRGNTPYGQYHGLCLETQHFPDSPNQPGFPSTVLRPGETYTQTTVHRFSTA